MINKRCFKLKKNGEPNSECFCRSPEFIENYNKAIADTTQTWDCHHRLETHNSDGERRLIDLSAEELIALDMYFDRPPEELIFLTNSEHTSLHKKDKISPWKGKHPTKKAKRKMSESAKKRGPNFLGKKHTKESKKKMKMEKGFGINDTRN